MLSLRSKLCSDYIVWHVPTAVEVAGQVHSSLAVFFNYYGHVGRHGVRCGRRQRLFYAAKCCQVAQLVNRGKEKWECTTVIAFQRLGRGKPGVFARLQAIMCLLLLGRGSCEKQVRIAALGHTVWSNLNRVG